MQWSLVQVEQDTAQLVREKKDLLTSPRMEDMTDRAKAQARATQAVIRGLLKSGVVGEGKVRINASGYAMQEAGQKPAGTEARTSWQSPSEGWTEHMHKIQRMDPSMGPPNCLICRRGNTPDGPDTMDEFWVLDIERDYNWGTRVHLQVLRGSDRAGVWQRPASCGGGEGRDHRPEEQGDPQR
jgi:hypothetical protein